MLLNTYYFTLFKKLGYSSFLVLLLFFSQGCHSSNLSPDQLNQIIVKVEQNYPNVKQIDTKTAAQWLVSFPDTIILDIREKNEFTVSHIKNAYNIPPNTPINEVVSTRLKNISLDHKIIVYCSVGFRSSEFAKKLQAAGYTNVYNIKGSLFAWVNEDRFIYQGNKRVNKVHPFDEKWGHLLLSKYRYKL